MENRTIEVYDARAEHFVEKFRGLFEIHREYLLGRFITLLPGKRILDVGCGGGDYAVHFLERGLSVCAIDLSPAMVRIAKSRGVGAHIMDMEDLRPDGLFDGIWCVTSLLHIPKLRCRAVVQRMRDLLVPGGIIYVCVKRGEGEGVEDDGRFFSYWEPQEIKALFCSFELVEEREVQPGDRIFIQMIFRKQA